MIKFSVLCAFLMVASGNAFACKCAQSSLTEKLKNASVAFVGASTADPLREKKHGELVSFTVSRPLKGEVSSGKEILVNPLVNTDCEAPMIPGAQLLVFGYGVVDGGPIVNVCSIRATEPISIEGELLHPSPEVAEFLHSVSNYSSKPTP